MKRTQFCNPIKKRTHVLTKKTMKEEMKKKGRREHSSKLDGGGSRPEVPELLVRTETEETKR